MIRLSIIYVVIFGVGPISYLLLLRGPMSKKQQLALGAIAIAATGLCVGLRYRSAAWGQDMLTTYLGLALIWVAWIAILVFVVRVLRRQFLRRPLRRMTTVVGALATTIPWFGLASARMMTF